MCRIKAKAHAIAGYCEALAIYKTVWAKPEHFNRHAQIHELIRGSLDDNDDWRANYDVSLPDSRLSAFELWELFS
jgi:hypothetical protein